MAFEEDNCGESERGDQAAPIVENAINPDHRQDREHGHRADDRKVVQGRGQRAKPGRVRHACDRADDAGRSTHPRLIMAR